MKTAFFLLLLTAGLVMGDQPKITIRLSFKGIREPGTGAVQAFAVKDTMLNVVKEMNLALDRSKRGLVYVYDDFDVNGQMILIGDPNNNTTSPANPSYWWDVEPGQMSDFAVQLNAHPTEFAFRADHLNLYLPKKIYGAAGGRFPDEDGHTAAYNNFVVSGRGGALPPNSPGYGATMLHEMGHCFSLFHAFNSPVGTDVDGSTFGDDGMIDTWLDTAGSNHGYGGAARGLDYYADMLYSLPTYAELNATQKANTLGQWRNFYAIRLFGVSTYAALSTAQKTHIDASQAPTIASTQTLYKDLIAAANNASPNNPQKVFDDPALPHLTATEQQKVLNLINNYMGYATNDAADQIYTGMQLDTMADCMTFGGRLPVASGRTFFLGTGPYTYIGAPLGSSRWPYATLSALASSAPSPAWTANDQVLVRPGTYSGAVTFNKPMTLRVSSMNDPATNGLRTDLHATFGSSTNH